MSYPKDLLYTQDHEWIRIDGDIAFVGITEYAQKELGDIVFVEITEIGKPLSAGDTFGTIEAVKTVADLYMPVDGTVEAVNESLTNQPELVNNDPYGEGWMARIRISGSTDGLLSADAYAGITGA